MTRLPKWFVAMLALVLIAGFVAPALAAEAKGKLKSVSPEKMEFVFTDVTGKDWIIHVDPQAKVHVAGQNARLTDLKAGDEVTMMYSQVGDKFIATDLSRK
jgi:hypothetical protein